MKTRRDVFQAIADPTRRAILVLIAAQPMNPNALAAHFDTTRQAVSKHIRVLHECGLVTDTQDGREILYRINSEKLAEIDAWIEQFRVLFQRRFDQLDSLLANM